MGHIRFLLASNVLVHHAGGGIPSMSAEGAVEAFFVISGFYMALTFEAHYRGAGGVWKFYLSRVIRLYPLYLVALVLMALIYRAAAAYHWDINSTRSFDHFVHPADALQRISIWSLLFQDLLSVNEARAFLLPLRQAWSISAELAFYLLTPVFLIAGKRQLVAAVILLFAVKATVLHLYGFRLAYFPFPSQIGYFVLGILVYRMRHRLDFERHTARWLVLGFALLAVSRLNLSFESPLVPILPLANAVMIGWLCVAMPSATTHFRGRVSGLLGDISYGVYIIHLVVIDLLRAAPMQISRSLFTLLALAVTAGFSLLFETAIQSPIDRLRRRLFYIRAV